MKNATFQKFPSQRRRPVWKVMGRGDPVIEVWESFNGDLYLVTEKYENGDIFCYARLYSMPGSAEWGWSNIVLLQEQYGPGMIWRVPEKSWGNIETYEKGLLMKEEAD